MGNIPYLKGSAVMMILPYCQSKGAARFACSQAGCAECMEALLCENVGLIWMVMLRQSPGKADYADLLQEGRIALWHAILHYDPDLGYTFSTYACTAIRNRIWLIVRRSLRATGWLPWEVEGDILEESIATWQETQICQALNEELETLPERMRLILTRYHGLEGNVPQTYVEIGRLLGLNRGSVGHLHKDALVLLCLPMFSIRLRSICERQSRAAYRHALRQNRDWMRKRRGRK